MFNIFKSKWTKWSKIGDEKIVKIQWSPHYDPIDKEWVGDYSSEYKLIQEYTRHNTQSGLDERKEVVIRTATQKEYQNS